MGILALRHPIKDVSLWWPHSFVSNSQYSAEDVWPLQKKEALIDSIFRDFPIPPLIFAEVQDSEEGFWTWQCVDGKQRLTAITKFIDGMFFPPQLRWC